VILILATGSFLVAGCGSRQVTQEELDGLARSYPEPLYYAGREFEGLPLTYASREDADQVLFVYGDCTPGDDSGCSPPVQIQIFPYDYSAGTWKQVVDCRRLPPLRGVLSVRLDGRMLFTGRTMIKLYARGAGEEKRLAHALRPLAGTPTRTLPPPDADVAAEVKTACP
jgi:hypothetical protein